MGEELKGPQRQDAAKDRIRRAILSKGLKVKQFADDSGIKYPSLRDYYHGKRKPGFDAIAEILRFTGVSAEWLLLGRGQMLPDSEEAVPEVDEDLLAQIALEVDNILSKETAHMAEERHEDGGLYQRRGAKQTMDAGHRALITGNVYNRVISCRDPERRALMIRREAASLIRLYRKVSRD